MELKALQAQINPHFLFNTINTIAMLIRTDPGTARELLREFASFYRRMLEDNEELIPLRQELEYALTYLRFEQARFGDRLVVTEDFDADVLDTPVPAFILQPLVENCVQHGVRARPAPDRLASPARRDGRAVRVRITDDGVGISAEDLPRVLEPGFGQGLGIALKNVDDRLRGHFGPGSGLRRGERPGAGNDRDRVDHRSFGNRGGRITTMLKALLVDDEVPARSELRFLLDEAGGVEVVGEAGSASEALQLIKAIPYDVVFLDVDMPGLSGIQLAEALTELDAPARDRLRHRPQRARGPGVRGRRRRLPRQAGRDRAAAHGDRAADARRRDARARSSASRWRRPGASCCFRCRDIFHIMAKDDYSYIYTDGERYLSTLSLADLEQKLESQSFFRVHRRYLVNLAQVKEVAPMYGGTMELTLKDAALTQGAGLPPAGTRAEAIPGAVRRCASASYRTHTGRSSELPVPHSRGSTASSMPETSAASGSR